MLDESVMELLKFSNRLVPSLEEKHGIPISGTEFGAKLAAGTPRHHRDSRTGGRGGGLDVVPWSGFLRGDLAADLPAL